MRKLLAILPLLLAGAVDARAVIGIANSTPCFTAPSGLSTTENCTTTFSPTNGGSLLALVWRSDVASFTVSDGEGTSNTYAVDKEVTNTPGGIRAILFRAGSISGSGTYTITVTSAVAAYTGIILVELSSGGTLTLDASNAAANGGSTMASGDITTTASNTLALAFWADTNWANTLTVSVPTGFSAMFQACLDGSGFDGGVAAQTVASPGAVSGTWTSTSVNYNVAVLVAYSDAGGGGGGGGGGGTRRRIIVVP